MSRSPIKKTCKHSGETFEISAEDLEFYDRISPVVGGTKIPVPPPQLSPSSRARRRFSHVNQLYVYSRKCSASGKQIFSMFPEEVPFPVYSNELWWSDSWDALTYGRNFDKSRSFFEQFRELSNAVPHFARMVLNIENSDYCNNISACRTAVTASSC